MAEFTQENRAPITLAERFDRYCAEVEQIVSRGIEHPRFELKRSATIARDKLADRLDFVKLIQGMANAHMNDERFIVIGADQKERKFYHVEHANEFDPANLSQILSKYFDPQPRLEVFNNVQAQSGESYVLIVIGPEQPRLLSWSPRENQTSGFTLRLETSGSRRIRACSSPRALIWIRCMRTTSNAE